MNRHYLASLTTIMLLLVSSHVSAAIYKWKNEEGQVHYGSMPPQGVTFEKMGVSTKFTPTPAAKTEKTDANAAKNSGTSAAAGSKEKDPYTKAQHTELCTNAKKDIASLNTGSRLRVKQEDGSTAVMSDAEKTKRMKTMQDLMKKHCK